MNKENKMQSKLQESDQQLVGLIIQQYNLIHKEKESVK